jgi:polysaccharide pyruvyl transferase WcaK-like protein
MPYSTPTQIYLRGYYGYKNFGDELLFFGIIDRIANEYKTKNIYVEVGDITWMTKRVQKNKTLFTAKNIHLVEIKQHKRKWLTHIINMLGFGKYKAYFKCFGGGEVLSDERPIPHDGRNIPILFNASVRKRNFALFGGIGKANKRYTHILYKYLLPKARVIVARDKESYQIAYKYNPKTYLHEDFALEVLRNWNPKIPQQQIIPGEYILVNLNS